MVEKRKCSLCGGTGEIPQDEVDKHNKNIPWQMPSGEVVMIDLTEWRRRIKFEAMQ